jgi:hypothetical protein
MAARRSRVSSRKHVNEAREHFLAVFAAESKRKLGCKNPVFQADVIAATV